MNSKKLPLFSRILMATGYSMMGIFSVIGYVDTHRLIHLFIGICSSVAGIGLWITVVEILHASRK